MTDNHSLDEYQQACDAIRQAQERHHGKAAIHSAYDAHYKKGGELTQFKNVVVYIYVDTHVTELRLTASPTITHRVTQAIDSTVAVLSGISDA